MNKQKIAITGTSSGLGLHLATVLSKDYEIITINRTELNNRKDIDLTGIDILINNAGNSIGGGIGLIGHDLNQWVEIIDINLSVPIYLTQQFVTQNKLGKIIFITSKIVEKNLGGDSIYSAAKSGLSTFVECMRDELKSTNFKFIEIRPGRIKTNFAANRKIHNDPKNFYNTVPHMNVEEVTDAILFAIQSDVIEKITLNKN